MMKKIKAFTVLELAVVMIITGIVVSISYSSYRIIYKQYFDYSNTFDQIGEIMLLHAALNKDFAEAREIEKTNDAIILTNAENNTLTYDFYPEFLLRNAGAVTDTFFILPTNMRITYIEAEQLSGKKLVDKLYFDALVFGNYYPFHFKKNYGVDVFMELEEDQSGE